MNERPAPPPEGQLITAALAKTRPKLTLREAARRAGISEARWRQIAQGYVMVNGVPSPLVGPPETVARMAQVVGVQSFQLRDALRVDAAEALQELEEEELHGHKPVDQLIRETDAIREELKATLERFGIRRDSPRYRSLAPFVDAMAQAAAAPDDEPTA